ncbi:MAG: hypothetical protein FJY88_10920 [Candidatus Eisenbacteria bacterium]|nr:hypothetical protein [Candidatus Eisenbacteria bacterium]
MSMQSTPGARSRLLARGLALARGLVGAGCVMALLAVSSQCAVAADPQPDALDEALAAAGLTRADLGWRARGWWERYPQDIPHKLRHFDDLCAEPLAIVPFTRVMGATLTRTLSAENLAGKKNDQGAGALYRAVHDLGVNKRYGATRPYSPNLDAPPTPLHVALLDAWRAEGRAIRFVTFGQESPYPLIPRDLERACAPLPQEISGILGKLLLDLLDARHWASLAFRNTPLEMRARIASRIDLGAEETDALEYEPAMDDAARLWDEASLWYAGLKAVEALDLARLALADSASGAKGPVSLAGGALAAVRIDLQTPVGRILVTGTGSDRIDAGEGTFLIVDLGGDDVYAGSVGASHPGLPVAAALDLGGDDAYSGGDRSLGAGVTGVGALLDARGDDSYASGTLGQGVGHFGMGVLADLAGSDRYESRYSSQGAGFFGIGVLIDIEGKDRYTIWSDGQGFGGVAGVGVLADCAGDDEYVAVVDPAVTGRPSYHSEQKVAVSDAQGCAMGRRGDGSDGHSWAGGIGALLDAQGDDAYTAGNWAQGCGYWFGTGLVWDGAGDDAFRANGWASGSGAHFCIGAVVDESGDDLHSVAQNWGPAFGHDFTVAILFDRSGDDLYECGGDGIGYSINRSVVLCLDGGGEDRYRYAAEGKRPGRALYDPRFLDRSGPSIYWTEPTSVGLFLDAGGLDSYTGGAANDGKETDDPESDNARARNRGIFIDRAQGTIDLDRPQGGSGR